LLKWKKIKVRDQMRAMREQNRLRRIAESQKKASSKRDGDNKKKNKKKKKRGRRGREGCQRTGGGGGSVVVKGGKVGKKINVGIYLLSLVARKKEQHRRAVVLL